MRADEVITGIIVSYNAKEILERAVESIRKYHPKMKLVIIDGSPDGSACCQYVSMLENKHTQVHCTKKNIGHGRGLALGISYVETPYFLTIDSDIEMFKSPVQAMLDMMEDDTCVVGYVEKSDIGGHDYGSRPEMMKYGWLKYVHPYFSLYQLKEYKKYAPFIHHGAPAVNIMLDIYQKGVEDVAIKEFPGLGHSGGQPINNADNWKAEKREFIRHDRDGTKITIEPGWEKIINPFRKTITCLTLTGDRIDTFRLSRKWMKTQTMEPDQWLVIDDGFIPLPNNLKEGIDYVRREPEQGEGHTLTLNMRKALPFIQGDILLIWEDDDWYGPKYIETMYHHLKTHDLVGEGMARYYHVPAKRYIRIGNDQHASLCQTGLNRIMLPALSASIEGDPYIDLRLWTQNAKGYGFVFLDSEDKLKLHCGTKGLKGREGIGTGHDPNGNCYEQDLNLSMLEKWVGYANACIYMEHVGEMEVVQKQKEPVKIKEQPKVISKCKPTILFRRKGTKGDVMLTTPIIRELKKKYPESFLVYETDCPDLLTNNPYVDHTERYVPKPDDYDIVLSPRYEEDMSKNAIDTMAKQCGVELSNKKLEIYLTADQIGWAKNKIDMSKRYIAFHTGRAWKSKEWPIPKFRIVVQHLLANGYGVVELGDRQTIHTGLGNNCCGCSVIQTAALIQECCIFIGVDSLCAHLAKAVGTPACVIYGSVDPSTVASDAVEYPIRIEDLECKGCRGRTSAERVECCKPEVYCLTRITPEMVIETVDKCISKEFDSK